MELLDTDIIIIFKYIKKNYLKDKYFFRFTAGGGLNSWMQNGCEQMDPRRSPNRRAVFKSASLASHRIQREVPLAIPRCSFKWTATISAFPAHRYLLFLLLLRLRLRFLLSSLFLGKLGLRKP